MTDKRHSGLGMKRLGRDVGSRVLTLPNSKQPQAYPPNAQNNSRRRGVPSVQPVKEDLMKTPEVGAVPAMKKLYVLDTNVLMHDWSSVLRFKEHDIFIPLTVIRELDRNKKGLEDAAWNSRRASNFIESLSQEMERRDPNWKMKDGLLLEWAEGGAPDMGRIFIQSEEQASQAARLAGVGEKADDLIISATQMLVNTEGKKYAEIRLVSKDLNMRILARARDLLVDDYTTDLVVTNADEGVYSGMIALPEALDERVVTHQSTNGTDVTLCKIEIPEEVTLYRNQLVTDNTHSAGWIVSDCTGVTAELRQCKNFISKNAMHGINARNREQNFLLNLLMDTDIDFVTILGDAGTGKTLLSIVSALEQKKSGIYDGIIFTRATVPIGGEEIGFLPGTEHEKMGSWLGALEDNLEVICEAMATKQSGGNKMKQLQEKHSSSRMPNEFGEDTAKSESISALHREFYLKSISFMRGRTFLRRYIIIDEAQNLTPKQIKTLITRSGPGTKVICLGNLDQIDTPYLTASSSGLAYAIDHFKGWKHYAHITLARGERSRLAERAVEVM